jgi:outer membrane lipoprotein LolB
MRWGRLAWAVSLLLAGCATTTVAPPQLSADQQRNLLQGLAGFSFTGRVAIAGQDSTPSMEWRQQRDVAKVRLFGPMGVGGIQVEYSPERLRLETGGGGKLRDGEAEQLLIRELGFVPPFDSLRYWVLGVPAPGSPAGQSFDAEGRVQQMEQQDWLIRYDRHVQVISTAGAVQLPAKLVATRDGLRLTLVIDRWRIK